MKSRTIILLAINLLVFGTGMGLVAYKNSHKEPPVIVQPQEKTDGGTSPITTPPVLTPIKNNISKANPSYMNYEQTVVQLNKWKQEAPEMTEVFTYGKSSRGKDCYCIRICNKRFTQVSDKPKVLVTACIHGNEPLASSTVMWYIGNLLDKYGKDEAITQLMDSRDLYFVPVLSPDSYPNSRYVDGVDPNRDFPHPQKPNHKSCAPVKAIQDLYNQIKPNAVMSGHTWGRVYLTPYGDSMTPCADHKAIMAVMDKVKALSGYRCIRACEMYGANGGLNNPPIRTMGLGEYNSVPIYGGEVDWFYRGGAFSSSQDGQIHSGAFSVVMEMGTHQRIPTMQEIKTEFDMTFRAVLYFIKEAPLVEIWWKGDQPVNRDGTPKKIALRTGAADYDTICNGNHTNTSMMTDMVSSNSARYLSLDTGISTDYRRGWSSLLLPGLNASRGSWSTESTPFGLTTFLPMMDYRRQVLLRR